jgi:hypothetical protein
VRRHAKASPAATIPTIGMAFGLACFCVLAFAATLGAPRADAADSCANALVRAQQNAQHLADCRAYEMVTPVDKNNGDVRIDAMARAATDGNGLEYEVPMAFAGAEAARHLNQYIGWRSPTGWTTEPLNPYVTPDWVAGYFPSQGYFEFTRDLDKGVLMSNHDPADRTGDVSEDHKRLYLRSKGSSEYPAITPPALTLPGPINVGPEFGGSSTDMSLVFYESEDQLTPDWPQSGKGVYEWHNGVATLIGRLPNGEVALEGASIGQGAGETADSREAVSGDGTQVVLTMGSPSQLYLRENGQSMLISDSRAQGEEGTPAPTGATFMGSRSADGRKLSTVYFASPDALTDDAVAEPGEFGANELYAYDVESGELSFLSVRSKPSASPSARVSPRWVAASKDGRYVYFAANGQLTPGAGGNVYLWHDGEVRALGSVMELPNTGGPGLLQSRYDARLSPDGKRLLIAAASSPNAAPLTPDAPVCTSANPGTAGCLVETFIYDAPTDKLDCISCSPTGPTEQNGRMKGGVLAGYPGLPGQAYRTNNLSADGSRAFFETAEPLVQGDSDNATDVYEWHEGQINLISSPTGGEDAYFMDATPDGQNVFIATRDRLVPEDRDNLVDAYAARVGGGFLYRAPVKCEGDACQAPPSSADSWTPPSSGQIVGPGSAIERRKSRCVSARKGKKAAKGSKGAKAAAKAKPRCAKPKKGKARNGKANAKRKAGNR